MSNVSVFSVSTGQIVRTLSCPEEFISLNIEDGQDYIEGAFDRGAFYVTDGAAVALPEKPSADHTFDYTTKQWVDARTLQDRKDAAWARIKLAREASIDADLVTPYGTFDCKAKDRTNITDAVLLLQTLAANGTPITIDFTLADNSTVTLTTTEMVTVGLLLGQKVQVAHANARVRRAEIDVAPDAAAIDAVVW